MGTNGLRSLPGRLGVCGLTIIFTLCAGMPAQALEGEHNRLPELCQGLNGAAYETQGFLTSITPLPYQLVPAAAAYASNWALKLCPPQILAPPTVKVDPDPGNRCRHSFRQSRSKNVYRNIEGIPIDNPDWGDLGSPQVYHFNTDSEVRILGGDDPDPLKDEWKLLRDGAQAGAPQYLQLPVGRNLLRYRADSLASVIDFVPLFWPHVPPGGRVARQIVQTSPSIARTFAKEAASFLAIKGVLISGRAALAFNSNPPPDSAAWWLYRHSEIGLVDDVYNEDVQEVWVYDHDAPTITENPALISTLPDKIRAVLRYDAASQTYLVEAIQPGGIRGAEARDFIRPTLTFHDECNRQLSVAGNVGQLFWATGSEQTITWTASDPGPKDANGGVNSATPLVQRVRVTDSYPPVLLAPAGFVREVPASGSTITVPLGSPRAYDLANAAPDIRNRIDLGGGTSLENVTSATLGVGLHEVRWIASDGTHESEAVQLVSVKVAGTNRPPVANAQTLSTRSFDETPIVLTAQDPDVNQPGNRRDPLSFRIIEPPQDGFFVAPLLPYFIDDVRLEAGAAGLTDPRQVDPRAYCRDPATPPFTAWQMGYPFDANWMAVSDEGRTIVHDRGSFRCDNNLEAISTDRFVIFDANQNIIATGTVPSTSITDIYWHPATDEIYVATRDNQGDDHVWVYDASLNQVARYNVSRWSSARPPGQAGATNDPVSIAVGSDGTLYVAGAGTAGVRAYRRIRKSNPGEEIFIEESFLGLAFQQSQDDALSDSQARSIALDSAENLYVGYNTRIYKVTPAGKSQAGAFEPGQQIGWTGKCTGNRTTTYACDVPNGVSVGFSCTFDLCARAGFPTGDRPGQFQEAETIAVDPNDILYVSDFGNRRVQRFTPDGYFAGQAKAVGQGWGFLLGDFAPVRNIEVNSKHFYLLDGDADLLHIFETTPIEPIDDASARVVYRSNNNFNGTDQFRFAAFDGLVEGTADVTLNVSRNFRPPSVPDAGGPVAVAPAAEDAPVTFTLGGTDPDAGLDTLSVVLVTPPTHGSLQFNGLVATYTPDANYVGSDSFVYRVFDGRAESPETGQVNLTVTAVEDVPSVATELELAASAGFLLKHQVEVFDPDANEQLRVSVDWGDGTQTDEGHFTLNGQPVPWQDTQNEDGTLKDGVDTTGPLLNVGAGGRGLLTAEHIFAQPGTYSVQSCVLDKVQVNSQTQVKEPTGASKSACTTTLVNVALSPALTLEAQAIDGDVNRGDQEEITLLVTNREFDLQPGEPGFENLPATGIGIAGLAVKGEAPNGLELAGVSSPQGTCTLGDGTFDCVLPLLAYGDTATIVAQARVLSAAAGQSVLALDVTGEALLLPEPARTTGNLRVAAIDVAPSITAVTPAKGSPDGYEQVTLTGDNFQVGATVYFGTVAAADAAVVDAHTIRATTLAQPAGLVSVRVVNPGGLEGTLSEGFRYGDAPAPPPPPPPPPPGGGGSGGAKGGGGGSLTMVWDALLLALALAGLGRRRRTAPEWSRTTLS